MLVLLAALAVAGPAPARDVTFNSTSDSHYDAFENEDRNARNRDTIDAMNTVANLSCPGWLGGEAVGRPRGVVLLGDVIDDGDRLWEGANQSARQYALVLPDFGLDGTDGRLGYPVFDAWGNHDGPPAGRERHGFSFQALMKERVAKHLAAGRVTNVSPAGVHYAWDWDDVHFVSLGLYPADRQDPAIRYDPRWHDPQGALTFLRDDLARHVGASGRPVVLMSHCGFDTEWWSTNDWAAVYGAAKEYNVILYLFGHSGTGVRAWAPPGEDHRWTCINDGQTENGFVVIHIGDVTNDGKETNWLAFVRDYGLDGKGGRLRYPVYETFGNHDGGPGTPVRRAIRERNLRRPGLSAVSSNGMHYAWRWDDVHFVMLGVSPGTTRRPYDPEHSTAFAEEHLAASVGSSGRPVVVMHHFGFDREHS
jgi:cytolysin (calcineurin-like family phosphatase)